MIVDVFLGPCFVEKEMFQFEFRLLFSCFSITDVSKVLVDLDETSKRRVDILDHFVVSPSVLSP